MAFKRKQLSQNFLINTELVRRLVTQAQFTRADTVIDIGAGTGVITRALHGNCKKVIAIELDTQLYRKMLSEFTDCPSVELVHADFRSMTLPAFPYQVFANIPFHITADILYKLLYSANSPERAFLILQKEAAAKFSGSNGSTQFSLLAGPWFDLTILYHFKHNDFYPPPRVEVVLLQITKRATPLVQKTEEKAYTDFIRYAFGRWKKNLKIGMKELFTYTQWKRLAKDFNFSITATPHELTLEQWLGVFSFFQFIKNGKNW